MGSLGRMEGLFPRPLQEPTLEARSSGSIGFDSGLRSGVQGTMGVFPRELPPTPPLPIASPPYVGCRLHGYRLVLRKGTWDFKLLGVVGCGLLTNRVTLFFSGGTVIKPPPGPPPSDSYYLTPSTQEPEPQMALMNQPALVYPEIPVAIGSSPVPAVNPPPVVGNTSTPERPEEPAKYISELPKLAAVDISSSAVMCGNWLAQLRQIVAGLSPSAVVWWQSVEQAASKHYQRWLIADPLDRLSLDPSGVIAAFDDEVKYQRVESRAVSLILAAIPQNLRDEAVSNRWLSTAALLFRIQCVYQPGGSSERSMLLSQLTVPESVTTTKSAVAMLRKWQQHFYRVRELGASMPDPSLLLAGIDKATTALLAQHHALGFRVNAFRHKVALEVVPKSGEEIGPAGVKALEEGKGGKAKGKGKGKSGDEMNPCHAFNQGKGCKFGDSCRFKHDRAQARKQKRCLACGQESHFRPECPLVAPEDRQVVSQSDNSNPSSPKAPSKASSPSKPKAGPQAKSVIEDISFTGSGIPAVTSEGSAKAQEALLAEAAKLLKDVSLKHLRVHEGEDALQELGIDKGWLISAVNSASDSNFALVDSGATNGLRPATSQELEGARRIKVDLAAGGTHLHINEHGTLLSAQPRQVILPAGYLVQLGFSITWRKKGCVIKRRGKPPLEVTVCKGCPLVSREQGLKLLQEYEAPRELGDIPALKGLSEEPAMVIPKTELRAWLATKVASGVLTRQDQLVWLRSMFPEVPSSILSRVAGNDTGLQSPSLGGVPWNRRRRRAIFVLGVPELEASRIGRGSGKI